MNRKAYKTKKKKSSPRVPGATGVEPEVGAEQRSSQRLGLEVHQGVADAGGEKVYHGHYRGEEAARQHLHGAALPPLLWG